MGIRFACHHCDRSLNIKRELAGRVGTCPDCKQRFRIPLNDSRHSLAVTADAAATVKAESTSAAMPAAASRATAPSPAEERGFSSTSAATSPLDDLDAQWFVRPPAGGQYGPADGPTLRQWIREHRVTAGTLVWRSGWPNWLTAREALPEIGEPPGDSRPAIAVGGEASSSGNVPTVASDGLVGDPAIGAVRHARSRKRLILVTILGTISLALILTLAFLALR